MKKAKGPNGGARKGAGRKHGEAKIRTQKKVVKFLTDGDILPLDVLMNLMRHNYNTGEMALAAQYARDAAPYLHPRLQSTELKGNKDQPLVPPDIQITFIKKKPDAGQPADNKPNQTPAPNDKRD